MGLTGEPMTEADIAEMRRQYPHATAESHMLVDGAVRLRCARCRTRPVPKSWTFVQRCDHCLNEPEPRPRDLLDRHLNRVGAREAVHRDPAAMLQLNVLRMLLDVVHSACDDEHLDPEVTRRILDKVIYGGVPQRPAVEQLLQERARFTEYMAGDTRPTVVRVSRPPADTSWIRSTE